MWKLNDKTNGLVSWESETGAWTLDAQGGDSGIAIADASSESDQLVKLVATEGDQFPSLGEQFIRGDELHLWYPQGDQPYGVRLAFQPIKSDADRLVLEVIISIQTTLLDSHPTLDLVATTQTVPPDAQTDGAPPISAFMSDGIGAAILLGPHDSPYTSNRSSGSSICLRLFGDFLEKGVIRKARPWLVLDRSGEIANDDLEDLLADLNDSPLPLTP